MNDKTMNDLKVVEKHLQVDNVSNKASDVGS